MKFIKTLSIAAMLAVSASAFSAPEISYSLQSVDVPERKLPLKYKTMHAWRASDKPYYSALENTFERRGNYLEVQVTAMPRFGTPDTKVKGRWITMTNTAGRNISISIIDPNFEELGYYECERTVNFTMRYKASDSSGIAAISETMNNASAAAMTNCMAELQDKMHADIEQIEEWNTQFVPGYGE